MTKTEIPRVVLHPLAWQPMCFAVHWSANPNLTRCPNPSFTPALTSAPTVLLSANDESQMQQKAEHACCVMIIYSSMYCNIHRKHSCIQIRCAIKVSFIQLNENIASFFQTKPEAGFTQDASCAAFTSQWTLRHTRRRNAHRPAQGILSEATQLNSSSIT